MMGGCVRSTFDGVVTTSVPLITLLRPNDVKVFVELSTEVEEVVYGNTHPMQKLDLFLPKADVNGFVFFVVRSF